MTNRHIDPATRRRSVALGAVLVAALLAVPTSSLGTSPAPGAAAHDQEPSPTPRTTDAPWRPSETEEGRADEVLMRLNEAREAAGLSPLQPAEGLDLLAYQHATEMARRGRVTHHSYWWGLGTERRLRLAFPRIQRFAENVARNRDVEHLHEALMASPGHRLNRLDPDFTHVGIGAVRADPYRVFLTEIFVRVPADEWVRADRLTVLYTETAPGRLEPDAAPTGQITGQSLRLGPPGEQDPEHWTRIGIDLIAEGRPEAAADAFRRALELAPDYAYARYDLGRALLAADRPAEARGVLLEYLDDHPEDPDAWSSLATAALLLGNYAEAERALRRVLEERPRNAGAWYNLGLSLEYQEKSAAARDAYLRALGLDPALSPAQDGLERVSG